MTLSIMLPETAAKLTLNAKGVKWVSVRVEGGGVLLVPPAARKHGLV